MDSILQDLPVLPTHNSSTQLIEDLNDFFIQIIIGFRDELQKTFKTGTYHSIAGEAVCQELFSFSSTSCTSVHQAITALPTKSCPLDPMPTRLLKDHLDDIVPATVNESCFPLVLSSPFSVHYRRNQILIKRF